MNATDWLLVHGKIKTVTCLHPCIGCLYNRALQHLRTHIQNQVLNSSRHRPRLQSAIQEKKAVETYVWTFNMHIVNIINCIHLSTLIHSPVSNLTTTAFAASFGSVEALLNSKLIVVLYHHIARIVICNSSSPVVSKQSRPPAAPSAAQYACTRGLLPPRGNTCMLRFSLQPHWILSL